jgi:hypothetical protein
MPEDAKPRFSYGQMALWRIIAVFILMSVGMAALDKCVNWYLKGVSERLDKVAKDVQAEAEAANPVGSTRQHIEDWLKANNFSTTTLLSEKLLMESLIKERNIPVEGAASYLRGERYIAGGDSSEKTVIYFFLGPDEKLILVYAEGSFIFL